MSKVIRKKGEGISSFDTEDLALAAALICKGHELIFMHAKEKSPCFIFIYHFALTSTVSTAAEDWKNNKLADIDEEQFKAEIENLIYQMVVWNSI